MKAQNLEFNIKSEVKKIKKEIITIKNEIKNIVSQLNEIHDILLNHKSFIESRYNESCG